MSKTLGPLSNGERLLVQRRRDGLTQRQAANEHGVTLYRYRQWETTESSVNGVPKVNVGRLRVHEQCLVYRCRARMTQAQAAKASGMSKYWLWLIEQGEEDGTKLIEFWQRRK